MLAPRSTLAAVLIMALAASLAHAGLSVDQPVATLSSHPDGDKPIQDEPLEGYAETAEAGPDVPRTLNELADYFHSSRKNIEKGIHAPPVAMEETTSAARALSGSLRPLLRGISDDCDPRGHVDADLVWTPDDTEGYDASRLKQYAWYLGSEETARSTLAPSLIVECSSEAHVQSAVRFAARCGYTVSVRSGGHSYTGSSSCHSAKCMQLDLEGMNSVSVSGIGLFSKTGVVTAEPGARIQSVARKTLTHLMSVPHGGCADVAVGGHYQSSGWGMLTQSHGSGLDYVRSFRMVMADGEVKEFSRDDEDSTHYKAVLGSAPGSWGVITQYSIDAIGDRDLPHTRMMFVNMKYTKENFLRAFRHTMFIVKDQEEKGLRDMKILLVIGPNTNNKPLGEMKVRAFMFWSGIDSGHMSKYWRDRYLSTFYEMEHDRFPDTVNIPAPLSYITMIMTDHWANRGDRYAVDSYHSDYWWDDEFIEILVDEIDDRIQMMPDVYPNFQFLPLGTNSQWARNDGKNSLPWRQVRSYVDDWVFVPNIDRYDEVVERMRAFKERTRKYWEFKSGVPARSTWMSPSTIYPDSTDLTNIETARGFFPEPGQFEHLQQVKKELDPHNLFSNKGTIPLP